MAQNNTVHSLQSKLKVQVAVLGGFVAFIWLLEMVDQLLFRGALDNFGVWPRTAVGLWGILLAPVLHAGFGHVMANTVPFVVLGWFVLVRRLRDFVIVSIITVIVSGHLANCSIEYSSFGGQWLDFWLFWLFAAAWLF